MTDANNHPVATNTYDVRNRLTKSCDALNNCATYTQYDADDNLKQVKSGTGIETDYIYDNLNRRTEIDYGVVSGNPTSKVYNIKYDLADRLTQAVDSKAGTITRQYGTSNTSKASGLDFVTQEVTPQGTVSYGDPDAAGRRTTMTVTAGTAAQPQVSYVFDAADKLTSVSQNGLTTTKAFTDPAGRLKTLTLPNHLAVSYGYDKDSHVTLLTYGSLGTLSYGYDADGRRTILGGSLAATSIPAPQTFSYNADNSLKTVGSSAVSNDNDGNLTCIAGNICPEFSYDERGHLQQWVTNPYAIDYSYDAFGRRYDRNVGGLVSVCYQYDGLNPVATTFDCDSSLGVTSYLNGVGLDELFMVNNGTNQSFLRDGLNSTIALTDASGTIVDRTTYDPYGNTTDSVPSQASAFEFAGRENEGNAGYYYSNLYFMRGRYYDASIGRFISRDPAGVAGGVNLYEYAGDDPVDLSDPTGLDGCYGCEGNWGPAWGQNPTGGGNGGADGGFVGAFVYQAPAVLENAGGSDIPEGRQTNGGIQLAGELFVEPDAGYIPHLNEAWGGGDCCVTSGFEGGGGAGGEENWIGDRQLGRKFGQHMDPNQPGYRTPQEYRDLANKIRKDPEAVRKTLPNGDTQIRLGNHLLRLDPQGNFRSLYPVP